MSYIANQAAPQIRTSPRTASIPTGMTCPSLSAEVAETLAVALSSRPATEGVDGSARSSNAVDDTTPSWTALCSSFLLPRPQSTCPQQKTMQPNPSIFRSSPQYHPTTTQISIINPNPKTPDAPHSPSPFPSRRCAASAACLSLQNQHPPSHPGTMLCPFGPPRDRQTISSISMVCSGIAEIHFSVSGGR
jgi:hypothetical protein